MVRRGAAWRVLARWVARALWGLTVAAAAACSQDNATTAPTPTGPTNSVETFTGSVQVGGSAFSTFSTAVAGPVFVTLTQTSPSSAVVMGVGVGRPEGSVCGLLPGASTNTGAGAVVQLSGLVTPGTFCVQVYDVGNLTETVTYTLTVSHF